MPSSVAGASAYTDAEGNRWSANGTVFTPGPNYGKVPVPTTSPMSIPAQLPNPNAKPTTIIGPGPAISDFNTKQNDYNAISTGVTNQAQNNKAIVSAPPTPVGTPTQTNPHPPLPAGKELYQWNDKTNKYEPTINTPQSVNSVAGVLGNEAPATPTDQYATALGKENTNYQNQLDPIQQAQDQNFLKFQSDLQALQTGTFPLTGIQQSQILAIQAQTQQLVNEQTLANKNYEGGVAIYNERSGLSKYSPQLAMGNVMGAVSAGLQKIQAIEVKATAEMATLQTAFEDKNYTRVNDSYKNLQDYLKQKADTITSVHKEVQAQLKDYRDFIQTTKTKPIQDIATEAAKNGASKATIAAINASQDVAGAISAAGGALQTATGVLGDYLQYKRDTEAKGLVPVDYGTYKDQQDAKQAKLEASKAYSNAYGAAAGKAAANNALGLNADGTPLAFGDAPTGGTGDILSATGLSIPAFNFLTQGTSALTRMTASQRLKYMNEAQNFAKSNHVDISTLQSQYKALGLTVQANSLRNNQAAVAESELDATLKNLTSAADASSFGSIRWGNVAKLFAGQEFNDPSVSKYAFHLNQLREEFAMYNAALSGQIDANGNIREIQQGDRAVAENIIKTGFSTGSIQGFQEALTASRDKMKTVLESSINTQNQNVWKLFGVGDKYQTPPAQIDPEKAVLDYSTAHPENADKLAQMAAQPGATPETIYKWLKANNYAQ